MKTLVFKKPENHQPVSMDYLNELVDLARQNPLFQDITKKEGFEFNQFSWNWEWMCYFKGSNGFITIHPIDDSRNLMVHYYMRGNEQNGVRFMFTVTDRTTTQEASNSMVKALYQCYKTSNEAVKKNPNSTNYTQPKKKRR